MQAKSYLIKVPACEGTCPRSNATFLQHPSTGPASCPIAPLHEVLWDQDNSRRPRGTIDAPSRRYPVPAGSPTLGSQSWQKFWNTTRVHLLFHLVLLMYARNAMSSFSSLIGLKRSNPCYHSMPVRSLSTQVFIGLQQFPFSW